MQEKAGIWGKDAPHNFPSPMITPLKFLCCLTNHKTQIIIDYTDIKLTKATHFHIWEAAIIVPIVGHFLLKKKIIQIINSVDWQFVVGLDGIIVRIMATHEVVIVAHGFCALKDGSLWCKKYYFRQNGNVDDVHEGTIYVNQCHFC